MDILGTQEVLHNQLEDLKQRLPEYGVIGVGREDGKEKGEYSALWYQKDRFNLLDSGYFWLSETPEVAGSKGWDRLVSASYHGQNFARCSKRQGVLRIEYPLGSCRCCCTS